MAKHAFVFLSPVGAAGVGGPAYGVRVGFKEQACRLPKCCTLTRTISSGGLVTFLLIYLGRTFKLCLPIHLIIKPQIPLGRGYHQPAQADYIK